MCSFLSKKEIATDWIFSKLMMIIIVFKKYYIVKQDNKLGPLDMCPCAVFHILFYAFFIFLIFFIFYQCEEILY